MSAITLTDRLLRDALTPAPTSTLTGELAAVVSERTRRTRQAGRRGVLPWLASPAATLDDVRRVRLVRMALLAALLVASGAVAVAGARLVLKPQAPPQVLLLQGGLAFTVPLDGGARTPVHPLLGRDLFDFSLSQDGSSLATLRDRRGILEIWDAADVLNGTATGPIALPNTEGLHVLDAGAWRPDGRGLLVTASERGAHRVFLIDIASGSATRVSPPNVYVDDWQPSFDGRWIEIAGQFEGRYALFVVDLEDLSYRVVMESDGGRVPQGGGLGWSPDSTTMTFRLKDGIQDLGIWSIGITGSNVRQVTPPGQPAWWMNWSPDGRWLAYEADAADPACATASDRRATWIVHPDGSDAHVLADGARPLSWADDSRSMIVDTSEPIPGAPLGGVKHVFLDGSAPSLVYAYTATDASGQGCHPHEVITKFYRGMARGIR